MGKIDSDFFDIEFFGKATSGGKGCEADVTVSKNKNGMAFTFRNDIWEVIGERLRIGIKDNYLFFKPDEKYGWAVSARGQKNPNARYMKIAGANVPKGLETFVGDYDVQYMEPLGMYYIKKENNEQKK